MGLFLKYLLISILIFGVGCISLLFISETWITPSFVLVLIGNSVSWIMYLVRKNRREF